MFTSAPFPPPLFPSFPTFAATLLTFPSPLFLPLLHPCLCIPPFADQNQLSPSFLLELFSSHSFYFSLSAIVFFTILIISKEFLPPRYAFSYLISVCTHLPERILFCGCTSCILSGKFFIFNCQQERFHMYAYVMLF